MTDDDRMERAERIRQMREGQRGNQSEDDDANQTADSASDGGDEGATGSTADDPEDDPDRTPDAPAGETEGPKDDPSEDADGTDTTAGQTDDTGGGNSGSDGPDLDEEAAAVVQQVAQAAAEVDSGGDVATEEETADEGSADMTDAVEAVEQMTGIELPDQDQLEAAAGSTPDAGSGTGPGARGETTPDSSSGTGLGARGESTAGAPGVTDDTIGAAGEETTRVLEFRLGDERYCLDITYVEEIVKLETITRVPNTPGYVEGVVDLRGQITTILDPKDMLDIDEAGEEGLIIVFDPDAFEEQGAIGWIVDEVQQVVPIVESEVNDPPVDEPYINGVVDREDEDQFVIWIEPDVALEEATEGDADDE